MKLFTKETLIEALNQIRNRGWIPTQRGGNDGGVGNTLEDLLGIEENNLPLPNAGEWEIKGQRSDTKSPITLFHMEPSPRACKFIPLILLPNYGWSHQNAGKEYPDEEMSFRQTLTAGERTSRGFTIIVNDEKKRVEVSFDNNCVEPKHETWLSDVESKVGTEELDPMPYWGFDDLYCKAGTKLLKTLYAIAERRHENGTEYFRYSKFMMLEDFSKERFISAIRNGSILVDFDARTGHNHGTKFRLRQGSYMELYGSVKDI